MRSQRFYFRLDVDFDSMRYPLRPVRVNPGGLLSRERTDIVRLLQCNHATGEHRRSMGRDPLIRLAQSQVALPCEELIVLPGGIGHREGGPVGGRYR